MENLENNNLENYIDIVVKEKALAQLDLKLNGFDLSNIDFGEKLVNYEVGLKPQKGYPIKSIVFN